MEHKHFSFGQAPFRFVGVWSAPSIALAEANPTAYNNGMASAPNCCHHTCDHCGIGIVHHMIIQDANGKRFAVGADCLQKIDDVENLAEAERLVKQRKREVARARNHRKSEARRISRYAASCARADLERCENWGLTKYEAMEIVREAEFDRKKELFADVADQLSDGRGGFCDSVASELRKGYEPSERAIEIVADIIGKQSGRRNSNAYWVAHDQVTEVFDAA